MCVGFVRGGLDRTGDVVKPELTRFCLPVSWKHDILRGLDHFAKAGAPHGERLEDPISLVRERRRPDGRWVANARAKGAVHFELEEADQPSRWVTLVCLRVLRWWDGGAPASAAGIE